MSSLSLCLVLAASLGSNDEKSLAVSPRADAPLDRGPAVPAQFTWADLDGDGRLELAALSGDGRLRLLAPVGGDRFEDATERLGVAGVENAALVLWADYDADGRIDLFVGAREGRSRLFRNAGGVLEDWSDATGLVLEGAVQSATWLDHDGDGRLDLALVTAEDGALGMSLFRGLEGGFFERVALVDLAGTPLELPAGPAAAPEESGSGGSSSADDRAPGTDGASARSSRSVQVPTRPVPLPLVGGGPSIGAVTPIAPIGCAVSLENQASDDARCLQASSTPTLGHLYPLSSNLFVAVSGEVGIGTTTPAARLDVAGTARISDTLTLDPLGDQALAIDAGSIYKDGALFLHTHGDNTGVGREALANVTGSFNTALGRRALHGNTAGSFNTAVGQEALRNNTTGNNNSASGFVALRNNTTGARNTACGTGALAYNTTGYNNTATGDLALISNTTGSFNTATGGSALAYNTTGTSNTASGFFALRNNTTGHGSTASGVNALRDNTTGSDNTAHGRGSLAYNTIGQSNTAAGSLALLKNTTGNNNTASGGFALSFNTTGNSNTASGAFALQNNTTGNFNTASGVAALLFNTTGSYNTAHGRESLFFNTIGQSNTAAGSQALFSNTTGNNNTACGGAALNYNTTGNLNTACGGPALFNNTTGNDNTASGGFALLSNTTGNDNTACGASALFNNTTGNDNIAVGLAAGFNLTTGSDNIAIGNGGVSGESGTIRIGTAGTHTRAFLAGIRGATTDVADAIPVMVDSNGQLGTISSSRRFKEEIRDMGDATERLLALRPVVFRYKPEVQQDERPLEYGLIAEEVAEIFPELVVFDEDGKPFTVKYHLLSSMLLNELQRLSEAHGRELAELRERLDGLETERRDTAPAVPAAADAAS